MEFLRCADRSLIFILWSWKINVEKRGHPGNQEGLGLETPGEFGVSKSLNCETYSLQRFDAVDWATPTGMASGRKQLDVGLLVVTV